MVRYRRVGQPMVARQLLDVAHISPRSVALLESKTLCESLPVLIDPRRNDWSTLESLKGYFRLSSFALPPECITPAPDALGDDSSEWLIYCLLALLIHLIILIATFRRAGMPPVPVRPQEKPQPTSSALKDSMSEELIGEVDLLQQSLARFPPASTPITQDDDARHTSLSRWLDFTQDTNGPSFQRPNRIGHSLPSSSSHPIRLHDASPLYRSNIARNQAYGNPTTHTETQRASLPRQLVLVRHRDRAHSDESNYSNLSSPFGILPSQLASPSVGPVIIED
ncbi:SubName: Full=Uncharacterized protein {ECO:0000313/EMBL:CCA76605.1} [Serendipita indica DSM 11827]|uniref:Uncharacterized protein n=1 Tax=Serendipita indica (strain DSM 11827) TaxID=1109443 RepID=G4TZ62_SERID|nr:SubName: Full=Uncharacterized protein {ECO:0000313/EMBL:CCA76605.1} [Serendipita indica DSM 11827]CCA76605.1 hypothetical protein PIIN_10596 [Serendipita indica DSM 11827]